MHKQGVKIYRDSPSHSVKRVNDKWLVETEAGSISADKVLVCTNGYTGSMLPGLSDSIVPVTNRRCRDDPLSDNLKNKILPERQGAADTQRLLSWFGIDGEDRLIFGSRINTQKELIDEKNFTIWHPKAEGNLS